MAGGLSAIVAAAVAYGCSSGSDTTNPLIFTSVYVDPVTLEQAAPCSELSGGMQSFFAELTDVTDPTIPAEKRVTVHSPVTTCTDRATFGAVYAGHFYTGKISAFTTPLCTSDNVLDAGFADAEDGMDGGKPIKVDCIDPKKATTRTPEWTLECGDANLVPIYDAGYRVFPDGGGLSDADIEAGVLAAPISPQEPTESFQDVQVKLKGCHVTSSVPGTTTAVQVQPTTDPAGPRCVVHGGTISRLIITPSDSALAPIEVACGSSATFVLSSAPAQLGFRVDAFEGSASQPAFGASCTSLPVQGYTVVASCDPFASTGELLVEPGALFGSRCNPDDIISYQVDLLGKGTSGSLPCLATARFSGLPAGLYTASVTATDAHGVVSNAAVCKAYISPGSAVFATCEVSTTAPLTMSVPNAPSMPLSRLARPTGAALVMLVVMVLLWLGFAAAIQMYGVGESLYQSLLLTPDSLRAGQAWRLLTAPFLHAAIGPSDATHGILNLTLFYVFTTPLQRAWGSKRLVVMLATAALLGELVQVGVVMLAPAVIPYVGGDTILGCGAMVSAAMVAWAHQNRASSWQLFGVLPIRAMTLVWIALGLEVVSIVFHWIAPEGALAPIVGTGVGFALGAGTPSPLRRAFLRTKQKGLESRAKSAPYLRVIEGEKGRGETPSGDRPPRDPKDKRWLNLRQIERALRYVTHDETRGDSWPSTYCQSKG